MTTPKQFERRNQTMVRMYHRGKTLQEIGDHYGMTRERVRQLLERQGVKRRSRGRRKGWKAHA